MNAKKRKKLEAAGWKIGTAAEFLGLSAAEEAFIELKLGLARILRDRRVTQKLTQSEAARLLGSSQSRFAKMEAADPSVSLDLMVRALFALGASPRILANAFREAATVAESPAAYRVRKSKKTAKAKSQPS